MEGFIYKPNKYKTCHSVNIIRVVLERPPGKSQVTLNINSGVKKTKRSSVQGTTVNNINGRVHIITCSTQIY